MSSSSSAPSLATNATSTPMSSAAAPTSGSPPAKSVLNLPPGFHFLPTDHELVVYYLRPRLAGIHRLPLPIFIYERVLDYHPDKLVEKYRNYGEGRWFFFTARERKHECGSRPNRTTPDNGHWNATGSIRPIRSRGGVLVGCRRTLVFYEASRGRKKKGQAAGLPAPAEEEGDDGGAGLAAKAKDGVKTEWTMYEYESLTSEAEFEAIRRGNVNKMDVVVLCTIQKKKHSQDGGGETSTKKKKGTKRNTKKEGLEPEVVPAAAAGAGNVEQGSRAAGTTEGQHEDHVQRALMEAAAAEPLPEVAYHAPAAGVDNFNIDPDQMAYYYLTNNLSPVPTPTYQEMLMAPASGDNHIVMHQENYYFINHSMNMKNSQSFYAQATPPQEFLPYLDTKMAAPRAGGNINTMDHMLQDRFSDMTPSQSQAPLVPGTGTYLSPLPGDKPTNRPLKYEDAWRSSHCQAKLSGRELNSNSLPFVPTPQQETVMTLVARGNNHTETTHKWTYFNHSMNMRNSQFLVQATTLPQQEFLPYSSSTKMAAPLGVGSSIVDHHMLQNRISNVMMPAAEAHTLTDFYPGLSNYGHLSTRMDDRPGPSSVSFPSQQCLGVGSRTSLQGPLLNNQVNLNHQNSAAASMVGYDQNNGVGLAPKIV